MSKNDLRAFQRQLFQALRDRPLNLLDEQDRKLYEPLYDDEHDPVRRLFDTIEFSDIESVQLVAGFRGTGKTTEFSRLEARLWENGYFVIRVDLDAYVDMHSAIDIRDFLLILAGAISDQLTSERLLGQVEGMKKSFWERARGLIPTKLEADVSVPLPGAEVKLALRSDPAFRDKVRDALAGRLALLESEVHAHHRDILDALSARAGKQVRLVVILDSLEHIRGTGQSTEAVRRSIEELFFTHASRIGLPNTHIVLSVPAFLALRADNLAAQFVNGAVQAWPACRVRDRHGQPVKSVNDRLAALVAKRGDWKRILPDREALDTLILASGGYLRDLLNMLVEALHLAGRGVGPDNAKKVIDIARRAYLPIYKDEIDILKRIAEARNLKTVTVEEQDYVLRFLDAHMVLCYLNDDFWYDVHPLVRDEVLRP